MLTSTSTLAEGVDRRGDEVVDVAPLADVAGDEAHRAIGAEVLDRRRPGVFVDIGDDDPRAVVQEAARDRIADAARAAGDDGDLVLERASDRLPCSA